MTYSCMQVCLSFFCHVYFKLYVCKRNTKLKGRKFESIFIAFWKFKQAFTRISFFIKKRKKRVHLYFACGAEWIACWVFAYSGVKWNCILLQLSQCYVIHFFFCFTFLPPITDSSLIPTALVPNSCSTFYPYYIFVKIRFYLRYTLSKKKKSNVYTVSMALITSQLNTYFTKHSWWPPCICANLFSSLAFQQLYTYVAPFQFFQYFYMYLYEFLYYFHFIHSNNNSFHFF